MLLQIPCVGCSLLIAVFLVPALAIADSTHSVDEQTGLASWNLRDGDFELELTQLLPDQTRAFYLARGFSRELANSLAIGCIMRTVGRNIAENGKGSSIDVNLRRWRMLHDGIENSIKLKEQWQSEWSDDEVSDSARLAFRWATFPTQQDFAPGDYGWGMTSYGLMPGEQFDLKIAWASRGVEKAAWIKGVRCAEER